MAIERQKTVRVIIVENGLYTLKRLWRWPLNDKKCYKYELAA